LSAEVLRLKESNALCITNFENNYAKRNIERVNESQHWSYVWEIPPAAEVRRVRDDAGARPIFTKSLSIRSDDWHKLPLHAQSQDNH
jgi:hypothetical protein